MTNGPKDINSIIVSGAYSLDGLVEDINNGDLGDANTSYTYFNLISEGYNIFSLDFIIEATTITFETSNDLPSVSNDLAVWRDRTSLLTGGTSSITATGSITVTFPFPWSRVRIKRVTTNATNAFEARLTRARA